MAGQAAQRIGRGQGLQGMPVEIGAPAQVGGVGKRPVFARRLDAQAGCFRQALHLVQAEPHGGAFAAGGFQGGFPIAGQHVGGQDGHAMALRILDQLVGRIKPHGLAVEQRGQEGLGFVPLEPGAGVGQLREAGGVRFGKAVFAEALDLAADGFGEGALVAVRQHAGDDAFVVLCQVALAPPGRHGAPQFVGLAFAVAGGVHGDLHDLFLEDGHAEGAGQRLPDLGAGIRNPGGAVQPGLFALFQEGMHHAALDGPGPDDGDLYRQVVQMARLQAGQHAHLRARFDLEHAYGVCLADHVVGVRVVGGNAVEIEQFLLPLAGELQGAPQRRQHAQGQHVDFEQADGVQIVLVPLHDAAVGHGGVLDGYQARQRPARHDEAPRVLGKVARKIQQLLGQPGPQLRRGRVGGKPAFLEAAQQVLPAVPPLVGLGDAIDQGQVHAQCAPNVAQRAARPVADDDGGQRGAAPSVFLVDVLDDFFAPLVFEVDVDVRRFVAFLADEASEQRVVVGRDHGDAQAEADRGVGGRSASLAEDAAALGESDQVVDGKEVRLVPEFADQREFFFELLANLVGDAFGETPVGAGIGLVAQIGGGCGAGRHQFLGVFVLQFVEVEGAQPGHAQAFPHQLGAVDLGQMHARTQVLFGIRRQRIAAFGHGLAQADAAQRVVQGLARADVHLDLAQRHDGQVPRAGDVFDGLAVGGVAGAIEQRQAHPAPPRKGPRQPVGLFGKHVAGDAVGGREDGQAVRHAAQMILPGLGVGKVAGQQAVAALGGAHASISDQFRQVAVAFLVGGQQDQVQGRDAVLGVEPELAAQDQVQLVLFCRRAAPRQNRPLGGQRRVSGKRGGFFRFLVRAHDAGQGAFVGDGQGRVAQFGGALDQFPGPGGAAQEGEVRQALQLGIAGQGRARRWGRWHGDSGVEPVQVPARLARRLVEVEPVADAVFAFGHEVVARDGGAVPPAAFQAFGAAQQAQRGAVVGAVVAQDQGDGLREQP